VTVGDGLHREILLVGRLAAGGELGDRTQRGRLGRLAAGVRIHLGIHHQDVHVSSGRQHMIQTRRTDIVGPTVATDDTHRAAHQVIGDRTQIVHQRTGQLIELGVEILHPAVLNPQLVHRLLGAAQQSVHQGVVVDLGAQLLQPLLGQGRVQVGRQPHAETELGVVLEQGVRPGGSASLVVLGPWGGRQVAAVDGRAAGGVGDLQPVTEQLGEQLQVRRLATTRAGARELEQRGQELHTTHRRVVDLAAARPGDRLEELHILALLAAFQHRSQVDGLALRLADRRHRAGFHAQAATGAVLRVDLQRVPRIGQTGRIQRSRIEAGRRTGQTGRRVVLGAQHRVRADERAVPALDAGLGIPDRDDVGDVPLLVLGGAAGEGTVHRKFADRQRVTLVDQHGRGDVLNEIGSRRRHRGQVAVIAGDLAGHLDLVQVRHGLIDGDMVLADDLHRLT